MAHELPPPQTAVPHTASQAAASVTSRRSSSSTSCSPPPPPPPLRQMRRGDCGGHTLTRAAGSKHITGHGCVRGSDLGAARDTAPRKRGRTNAHTALNSTAHLIQPHHYRRALSRMHTRATRRDAMQLPAVGLRLAPCGGWWQRAPVPSCHASPSTTTTIHGSIPHEHSHPPTAVCPARRVRVASAPPATPPTSAPPAASRRRCMCVVQGTARSRGRFFVVVMAARAGRRWLATTVVDRPDALPPPARLGTGTHARTHGHARAPIATTGLAAPPRRLGCVAVSRGRVDVFFRSLSAAHVPPRCAIVRTLSAPRPPARAHERPASAARAKPASLARGRFFSSLCHILFFGGARSVRSCRLPW